jgi:hypothetical protein
MSTERNDNRRRYHEANGGLNYCLEVFGDYLAQREGYKDAGLDGMDAIHFYLVHKFHWMPKDVRAMSTDDLRFVLTEELSGWTLPAAYRP